jgi:hypothetical protein
VQAQAQVQGQSMAPVTGRVMVMVTAKGQGLVPERA